MIAVNVGHAGTPSDNSSLNVKIEFPKGIIGFPKSTSFFLESSQEFEPFLKLKSCEEQGVEFVLVDPWLIREDYNVKISDVDQTILELKDKENLAIFTIVTIYRKKSGISLNLAAPVAINLKRKIGLQLVLDNPDLPLRYFHPIS